MKIQCDVCDKDEASVFCVADEAALCTACDHRVHHANKLAGKHQRFSLLQPSAKQAPLCDICQDRRAFLFCQEDRAILCRECDIPIHKANEHTQKHNRFLLTGVKLSATSSLYSLSSSFPSSSSAAAANSMNNNINVVYDGGGFPNLQSKRSTNKPISKNPIDPRSVSKAAAGVPSITNDNVKYANSTGQMTSGVLVGDGGGNINNVPTSSSISEYLIEMLPGWHVEDFLDPSSPPPFGFCKSSTSTSAAAAAAADYDMSMIPLWNGDDEIENNLSCFSSDSTGASWVPQSAPPFLHPTQQIQIQSFPKSDMVFGGQIMSFKGSKDLSNIRKWNDDNSFAVPQINNPPPPPSTAASKRCRTLL